MADPAAPNPIDAAGKKGLADRAKGGLRKAVVGMVVGSQIANPAAIDLEIEQPAGEQAATAEFNIPSNPYTLGAPVVAGAPRSQGVNDSVSAPSNQSARQGVPDQAGGMSGNPSSANQAPGGSAEPAGQAASGQDQPVNPGANPAPEGATAANPDPEGLGQENPAGPQGLPGPMAGQMPDQKPAGADSQKPGEQPENQAGQNPEANPNQRNAQGQNPNAQNPNADQQGNDNANGLPNVPGMPGAGNAQNQQNPAAGALNQAVEGAAGQEIKAAKNEQFWGWYFGIFPGLFAGIIPGILDLLGLHVWWMVGHYRKEVALTKTQKIALVALDLAIPFIAGAIVLIVFAAFCNSPAGWLTRLLPNISYCKPFQPF